MNPRQFQWFSNIFFIICMIATAGVTYWHFRNPVDWNHPPSHTLFSGPSFSSDETRNPLPMDGRLPPLAAFEPGWNLSLRKPLFDPQPVKAAEKVFVPPPFPYQLTGTVMEPDNAMAMFVSPQGKIEIRRKGEQLGEATILNISQNQVRIRYYDQEQDLDQATTAGKPAGKR